MLYIRGRVAVTFVGRAFGTLLSNRVIRIIRDSGDSCVNLAIQVLNNYSRLNVIDFT